MMPSNMPVLAVVPVCTFILKDLFSALGNVGLWWSCWKIPQHSCHVTCLLWQSWHSWQVNGSGRLVNVVNKSDSTVFQIIPPISSVAI